MRSILDEHTRLHGIVGIHLLESGVVARGQVKTLNTVVALDGDLHLVLSTIRLQLPFATDAKHHDEEQQTVYLFHLQGLLNVKIRCKFTKKYFKNQILA